MSSSYDFGATNASLAMPALVFDLETLPTDDPVARSQIEASVTHPAQMKKADTIEKWHTEKRPAAVAKALHRSSLNGTYGRICVIAWKMDGGPVRARWIGMKYSGRYLNTERDLLRSFWRAVGAYSRRRHRTPLRWVGHNICTFDLRYLWQRSKINGVRPTVRIPYDAKPWAGDVYDTMHEWAGGDRDHWIKLDELARVLDLALPDDGISGSEVADVWDQDHMQVVDHCMADVSRAAAVYQLLYHNKRTRVQSYMGSCVRWPAPIPSKMILED